MSGRQKKEGKRESERERERESTLSRTFLQRQVAGEGGMSFRVVVRFEHAAKVAIGSKTKFS